MNGKGFSFYNLCNFTLCDFSLECNWGINRGAPVLVTKVQSACKRESSTRKGSLLQVSYLEYIK